MGALRRKNHWFSFKDSCVSILEVSHPSPPHDLDHVLFFLHGRFGQSEMWLPLMTKLAHQYTCLAVDLPGFGRSFLVENRPFSLIEHASLIYELIGNLTSHRNKVLLVGHDVGGGIAQLATFKSPRRTEGLVLLNSLSVTLPYEKLNLALSGWFLRRKFKRFFKGSPLLDEKMQESLLVPWNDKLSRENILQSLRALEESWPRHHERQVWKNILTSINRPALVLWGGNDPINSVENGTEVAQKLYEGSLAIHEKTGHWPQLEEPDWVLMKLKDFLFNLGFGFEIKYARKSL